MYSRAHGLFLLFHILKFHILSEFSFNHPALITGEGLQDCDSGQPCNVLNEIKQIHEENLQKLSSMSEKEILEEQAKLTQTIGIKCSITKV